MDKEKISISKIIDLMAGDAGFSRNEAEEFVYALFATIEEALFLGENVKIKGFGTFKLQWNEARESADPHNGNEIIIPGFYVVDFEPINELSEQINEPFAHLEIFPLPKEELIAENAVDAEAPENDIFSDGNNSSPENINSFAAQVDEIKDILSEIQALSNQNKINIIEKQEKMNTMPEKNNHEQIPDQEKTDLSETAPLQDEFDIVRDVSVIYGKPEPTPLHEEMQQAETGENDAAGKDSVAFVNNENEYGEGMGDGEDNKDAAEISANLIYENEDTGQSDDAEDDVPETAGMEIEVSAETDEEPEPEKRDESARVEPQEIDAASAEDEGDLVYMKKKKRNRKIVALAVSLFLLAVVGGVALRFFTPYLSQKFNLALKKELLRKAQIDYFVDSVANEIQIKKIKDSLEAQRLREEALALQADSAGGSNNEVEQQQVPELGQMSAPAGKPDTSAQKETDTGKDDVFSMQRVYNEFLTTERMTAGSKLTQFARKYYGSPHFWVYIFEANKSKIKNPNRVPAGLEVKIPKMNPRLVNPNDNEALEYAKKLQNKYLNVD